MKAFFGYHDKKPFNNDDTKIIFHSYKNLKSLKDQSKKKVSINLIDLKKDKMFILDNTKAWSWQIEQYMASTQRYCFL